VSLCAVYQSGGGNMRKIHEKYVTKLDELQALIVGDFEFYRAENSRVDRRLNELCARGCIEETATEMQALLQRRREVKDASLKLLPLRDFFRNGYPEVYDRLARSAEFDR